MSLFDFFKRKVKQAEGAPSESSGPTKHCFVLCGKSEFGDLVRADEIVTQVFGENHSADVSDKGIVTIAQGNDAIGFLMWLPTPIPNGEADECADRNFLWKDGKTEAAKHKSHVIIFNSRAAEQPPVQSALGVTRLTLVALRLFNGIGVYWGNAGVCNSRKVFEGFCENISEEHVPVAVWLRYQLVRPSEDELGIYTVGMKQFGLMEIEVDRCGEEVRELFQIVADLAHYLLQQGPVIADGNTIGEQRLVVTHRPSMLDAKRLVYKVNFDTK